MSSISTESPSSLTTIEYKEAVRCFKKYDNEKQNSITRTHCIQALQEYLGREISQQEIGEIQMFYSHKSDVSVEKSQYLRLVSQINHLRQVRQCNTQLGEQFLIDNFTKKEIKILVGEWQKVDEYLQGFLSLQFTRIVIENVLQYYSDSNANDSEIKQFFIQKADCSSIYFEEYMNFISGFLKLKNYRYAGRRGNNSCACTIF